MKIKILKDTIIKKQPIQSNLLGQNQKKCLKLGQTLTTDKIKEAPNNHIEIDNGLFLYKYHVEVIDELGSKSPIPVKYKSPTKLILDIPYLSQRDNSLYPNGTCNVTSVAMILLAYKKATKYIDNIQLEDVLTEYMETNSLDRHSPMDMRTLIRTYSLEDNFVSNATVSQIKKHLLTHNPVIVHGYFTSSGHIIVINGYDESKQCFIVCDPYGEYYPDGYDTEITGEDLYYSYKLIQRLCSPEGENYIWCHFISKQTN